MSFLPRLALAFGLAVSAAPALAQKAYQRPDLAADGQRLEERLKREIAAGARPAAALLREAEAALARGDNAEFATRINTLRTPSNLPAYSGQIPAIEMLKHERRVNLFTQMRRLHDMYRFGIVDSRWVPNAHARTAPGTLFPIGFREQISNCYITQTC